MAQAKVSAFGTDAASVMSEWFVADRACMGAVDGDFVGVGE